VIRRDEPQAAVEAVVLRLSGGRVLVPIISSSTVRMTARSASPASSRRVDCALADRPPHPAPSDSNTLRSLRHLHQGSGIFKSP
jgi:hypothetical protein